MTIDVDLQLYYANITSYKGVDVNKLDKLKDAFTCPWHWLCA